MSMGSLWITTGLSNCGDGSLGIIGFAGCFGLVKSGTFGMSGLISGTCSILLSVVMGFSGLNPESHIGLMFVTMDGQSQTLVMG